MSPYRIGPNGKIDLSTYTKAIQRPDKDLELVTCNWLLSEIDGDQECRMPLGDSGEAKESVVRRQHVQVSVGEGVFRPQLDEGLEGQEMRGLSTASALEFDVDRVHVGVDGEVGVLSGSEATGCVAAPLIKRQRFNK